MKILCINTAFPMATVCFENDNKKIYKTLDADSKSSEKVLPQIEEVLSAENLTPADLDYVGVVIGTGSFTGIRIGVALVKGFMCVFPKLQTVAVNSLDLMAYEYSNISKTKTDFYCIQNALSGRFFIAKYNNEGKPISEYSLINELPNRNLIGLKSENLEVANDFVSLQPENLLEFAKNKIANGEFTKLNDLTPLYLRLSQAEENLLKRGSEC